jgi:hypothetical protein
MEQNWRILSSLFLRAGRWQGGVERSSACGVFRHARQLLRMILLHVGKGYSSLRETTLHAKLANWAGISDVALLKRLRQGLPLPDSYGSWYSFQRSRRVS